ncbi:L-idonate 5-dehydrogenase [Paeniglutamicibacter sulfureus]|uniref:Threonine dehydrogenase-like Zn-dependent dehydrogenase n=1 Tax=Paeniglutamicibacter sulfureus TaxID=43666 RepID=A0ABU2BCR6_9MICC|nr:L-idonate 5-dehydrogenase [Paeniglutamicibacter sulfureus]MDR7356437.1 threonine dehydrogenase-like Zn-dependent dehydrogenase [Paeniglutamicibacter sulfureus]
MSSSTPATAVVAHAAGDLRVEAIEVPAPASHEAQIAIAYGGICGSDLHYWMHGAAGESILKAPMVLGHEIVGTVLAAAADGTGPAAGTRIAVHPATPGGSGARYPEERPNLSPGCTYLGSAARYPHTEGAFATAVNLPSRMLRELPAGLALRDAALAEPAAVAWHAVSRAGGVAGKRVMVIGAGPIGVLAVAVLKRAGAAQIIAVDMFDRPLEIATAAGATTTLKADDVDAIAEIEADVVIEASGNHRGLASAIRGTVRGGRIVMVGLLPSGEQPALISLAITRELELVGSFRFNDEIDEVLGALADGTLDVSAVVTHEFGVDQALAAFAVAKDSAVSGKVLLKF